ncbi:hypothetical protein OK348_01225 [Flavobacterium sp. MXW15]|uniref:Uncharacterized protein n=1 Tax=Xanthomonas chitinilytica TaxID=2989819 RepID=A0ABT3JUS7_9XANT|nr:hypothetical protein [Xanthomonas sp. H13-6]MCW4453425.1 hypothetical protein [Flavobacterium sp. MXW15]MCW4472222.1 hypothetical protein [Xanthomonas sp. H13-6]
MNPRLEYALLAGALAFTLAVAAGLLLDFRMKNDFLWQLGAMAGVAALLSAAWVGGWRWLVDARRRGWRLLGMVFFTVLVAMALFFPLCMGLLAILDSTGFALLQQAEMAAVFVVFAAYLGTLPAMLFTTPLAWRFLRRRERRAVA